MNPIRYAGAEPVFIGCGESLCLCPALAGEWLAANTEQRDGKCVNLSLIHILILGLQEMMVQPNSSLMFFRLCLPASVMGKLSSTLNRIYFGTGYRIGTSGTGSVGAFDEDAYNDCHCSPSFYY